MVDRGVAEPGRHAPAGPDQPPDEVIIRRSAAGWHVEGASGLHPVDELSHALTLADLLIEGPVPGPRPPRPAGPLDELDRLRASVRQLEHALASRVLVEQAIGVLTERWRVSPRDAFEQLRRVTRSRGVRIHELARTVVDSCTDAAVRLPPELVAAPRSATPPEPRRSPDRSEEARAGKPDQRQRQRGRRRGSGGAQRPREPYGDGPAPQPPDTDQLPAVSRRPQQPPPPRPTAAPPPVLGAVAAGLGPRHAGGSGGSGPAAGSGA